MDDLIERLKEVVQNVDAALRKWEEARDEAPSL